MGGQSDLEAPQVLLFSAPVLDLAKSLNAARRRRHEAVPGKVTWCSSIISILSVDRNSMSAH